VTDIDEGINHNASQMPIAAIIEQGALLRFVHCIFDEDLPNGPVAITFGFETASFCVLANASDDTISVLPTIPVELQSHLCLEIDDKTAPWNGVIGSTLIWSWLLTNQQGYCDGLQLEFRRDGHGSLHCFQMIAIASTLELRTLSRAKLSLQ
jgi:Family of unknown function (DUF6334)